LEPFWPPTLDFLELRLVFPSEANSSHQPAPPNLHVQAVFADHSVISQLHVVYSSHVLRIQSSCDCIFELKAKAEEELAELVLSLLGINGSEDALLQLCSSLPSHLVCF
jgi:hypothetical protein